MKKFILIICLSSFLYSVQSAPVSLERAKNVAVKLFKGFNKSSVTDYSILNSYSISKNGIIAYYVIEFNSTGFVMVAGDDVVTPILGYSYTSGLNPNSADEHLQEWLDRYSIFISSLIQQNHQSSEVLQKWTDIENENFSNIKSITGVPSLFETYQTSRWSYWDPYFNIAPLSISSINGTDTIYKNRGHNCCVPLSVAQILKYHKYPTHGYGSHTYSWLNPNDLNNPNDNVYQTISLDFATQTYNYDSMPFRLTYCANGELGCNDSSWGVLPNISQYQIDETGRFQFNCGIAVDMQWGSGGTYSSLVRPALINYFSYPSSMIYTSFYINSTSVSFHNTFKQQIKSELDALRPVYFAYKSNQAGHAIVIDGYENDNFFHFAMGRGGYSDGYYYLFPEDEDSSYEYSPYHYIYEAVIGIKPPPCDYNNYHDSYTLNNNTIWDSKNFKIIGTINVESGTTLEINNSIIEFGQNSGLIIKRGGKLIINNSSLKNLEGCNNTWQGIEVQGDPNLDQLTESNQGVLELKNGATIENAVTGVLLGHWSPFTEDYDAAYNGGIIRAEPGCTFKNNNYAINFKRYTYNNTSYINGCNFITDNNYIATVNNPIFIQLYNVTGVNIKGNTFKNNNPSDFSVTKRGTGIYSYGSKYIVDDITASGTTYHSKFENLYYGINSNNYISTNTFSIINSDFKNNYMGLKLNAVNYANISNNNIVVNKQFSTSDASYGIYLSSSSGYGIKNNNFTTTNQGKYGIYVTSTGTASNTIYQNNFTGLQVNIQANLQNNGLVMRCNSFNSTSIADIAVTGNTNTNTGGINTTQGTCLNTTSAANNLFSHNGLTSDFWTNPGTVAFNYSYNPSSRTTPLLYDDSKVIVNPCATAFNPTQMCLTRTTRQTSELLTDINSTSATLNQLRNKIDGGNTQNLLSIALSNQAPGQIKNALLAVGSYLSDEVLLAVINRTGNTPLPDGILKEIIVPNSPVTKEVMKAIIYRNPALSGGVLTDIKAIQTGISLRAELEAQIASATEENGTAINELLQQYLLDSTITNGTDSLIAFLQTQTDIAYIQQLIQAYIFTGQCTLAKTLLSQMSPLTADESYFITFFNVLADNCISGNSIQNLTEQELNTITDIANSETAVSANAQSLLSFLTGEYFPETFEPLIAPDTSKIFGYIYESETCGGSPVANDTLQILDESNNVVQLLEPIITNNEGKFEISHNIFYELDTTQTYSFATKSGYKIQESEIKTLTEWLQSSPISLTLSNSNLEWADLYSTVDSLYNGGTVLDLNGNLYVAGYTNTTLNYSDFLIIKYSPTGERLWVNTYNGSANYYDQSVDLAVDNENNCYVLGNSNGTGTSSDIVLLKYSSNGNKLWEKRINGTANLDDDAKAVVTDATNNVYITGTIKNNTTGYDIVTIKYSKTGQFKWQKTYSTSTDEFASTLKTDHAGNIIVAGYGSDYIIIKYNTNGVQQWLMQYDGGYSDLIYDMTVDNNNNIIVVGAGVELTTVKYNSTGVQQWVAHTTGRAFDIVTDSKGNIYITGNVNYDGFTLKYDPNGIQQWKKLYTTNYYNGVESLQAIAIDNNNDVYVTGFSATETFAKYFDMITIKYDSESNEKWLDIQSGGYRTQNRGNDIVVSENNNVYVTGVINENSLYKMATLKYSQCPSTASLKSAIFKPDVTSNNQTLEDIEDDELIQVINFQENKVIVYPNPYSESTRIELITKSKSDVSLEVFTMGGQKVADVFKGNVEEGRYNYTFSAKKLGYSAGTYILQITINGQVNSYWLVEMK